VDTSEDGPERGEARQQRQNPNDCQDHSDRNLDRAEICPPAA